MAFLATRQDNRSQEENHAKIESGIKKFDKKYPSLYIGLGGTGKDILLRIREKIFVDFEEEAKVLPISFLYYDLDQNCQQYNDRGIYENSYFAKNVEFKENELLLIKPDIPKILLNIKEKQNSHIAKWLSPGVQAMDVSIGAGQQRQISRLSFFKEYDAIRSKIESKLTSIRESPGELEKEVDINFVFSVAGGTGCGSFIDMAFLTKYLARRILVGYKVHINAHIVLPTAFSKINIDMNRLFSNGYAALKEIEHYMAGGNKFYAKWRYDEDEIPIETPIFNSCYLISGDRYDGQAFSSFSDVFNIVAEYLACEANKGSKFAAIKGSAKSNCSDFLNNIVHSDIITSNVNDNKTFFTDLNAFTCKYSSYGLAKVGIPSKRIFKSCSAKLAIEIINNFKNSTHEFDPNKVEESASKFAERIFIKMDDESGRLKDLLKKSSDSATLYDELSISVDNLLDEVRNDLNTNPSKYDSSKLYAYFNEKIIGKLLKYSENANLCGEFVKIIGNNLNNIKNGMHENKEIEEKFFEIGMMVPDVSIDYGIGKTNCFFNKLFEIAKKNHQDALDFLSIPKDENRLLNLAGEGLAQINQVNANMDSELSKLKKQLRTYDKDYRKELDDFNKFPWTGILLKSAGTEKINKMTTDLNDKIGKKETELKDTITAVIGKLKAEFQKYAKEEMKRQLIVTALKDYYDNYIFHIFSDFQTQASSKYFLPFVNLERFEKMLGKVKSRMEERYSFFSLFKPSATEILIKDGNKITDKSSSEIIDDYFKYVNSNFEIKFNKEYLKSWTENFYTSKKIEVKEKMKDFITDIIEKNDISDENFLFNSVMKLCDKESQEKLEKTNNFDIYRASTSEHTINAMAKELVSKLSEVCFSPQENFSGVKDEFDKVNNHIRGVLVKSTLTDGTSLNNSGTFGKFYNEIKSYLYDDDKRADSVMFFTELHGFPLYFLSLVQQNLKEGYKKMQKEEYSRPLHIENGNKFKDLIPILEAAPAGVYREKIKISLYSMLLGLFKYDDVEDSYSFKYLQLVGKPLQIKKLRGGYWLTEDMENTIEYKGNTKKVKDYLKEQYERDGALYACIDNNQNELRKLNINGKIKLYKCLIYLEKLIQLNLPKINQLIEISSDESAAGRQPNTSKVSSVKTHIIALEQANLSEIYISLSDEEKKKNDLKYPDVKPEIEDINNEEWKKIKKSYSEFLEEIDADKVRIKFIAEDVE